MHLDSYTRTREKRNNKLLAAAEKANVRPLRAHAADDAVATCDRLRCTCGMQRALVPVPAVEDTPGTPETVCRERESEPLVRLVSHWHTKTMRSCSLCLPTSAIAHYTTIRSVRFDSI